MEIEKILLDSIDDAHRREQARTLITIIHKLGWSSILSDDEVKVNLRTLELYIRKHKTKLDELFGSTWDVSREDLVIHLNYYLLPILHLQLAVVGDKYKIELYIPKDGQDTGNNDSSGTSASV